MQISRRNVMATAGGMAAAAMLGGSAMAQGDGPQLKGNIKQSACKWCYGKIPLDEFCAKGKALGLKAVDLLGTGDFATVKKYGLECSMVSGVYGGIETGLNRKENHERIIDTLRKLIDATSEAGFPNVICFSGNRHKKKKTDDGKTVLVDKVDDEEGIRVCAEGIKQVIGYAEQKKVNIVMELLNSKVNHPDYMCDRTPWGVELCKAVGSERFKLLYDIYHMQIDEGDVIATIRKYKDYIAHYHTGGVPGRNEIDETQELYYPAIVKAIVETGFKGYLAHEFIPKKDPLTSLEAAIRLCDV